MKINADFTELRMIREQLNLIPNAHYWTKIDPQLLENEKKLLEELDKGVEIGVNDFKKEIKVVGGILTREGKPILLHLKDNHSYRKHLGIDDIKNNSNLGAKFHIGWCKALQDMKEDGKFQKYIYTNDDSGGFTIDAYNCSIREKTSSPRNPETYHNIKLNICKYCLSLFEHKGYNHQQYSNQEKNAAVKNFNIKEFLDDMEGVVRYLEIPTKTAATMPVNDYTTDFSKIASRLKKEKNYTCEECKKYFGEIGKKKYLHTHHKNSIKNNNSRENLKILCINCHMNKHHADIDWKKIYAIQFDECRRIKREQGISVKED